MSEVYSTIANQLKPFLYAGLVAATISGCKDSIVKPTNSASFEASPSVKQVNKYHFTDCGIIDEIKMRSGQSSGGGIKDDLELTLGDLDGDGDLDIIVGSNTTGLRIYENKIPQKNSRIVEKE